MADINIKTTSSKPLDGRQNVKIVSSLTPKSGEAQILTKLAQNISESYQLVKQRQQKFLTLSIAKQPVLKSIQNDESSSGSGGEWQEVCSAKNKLKRKKKLSTSLTSVTDSVNQEKRTRIEGIQLNCRGKLQITNDVLLPTTHSCVTPKIDKVITKPPVPPLAMTKSCSGQLENNTNQAVRVPPPRVKRKLQENIQTIQKLNAMTEQLRLEINELKSSLTTERGAVRVLRAQNESETRKWKNEVKKLQNVLEQIKKTNALPTNGNARKSLADATNAENLPSTAASILANYEIQRLTNEINMLKETYRASEEKKLIDCDADRRKAADMRTLRDSYEIRLTQLKKSAKIEISRLLEEIKTKERNIGQLKKDLQLLQAKPQNETTSTTTSTTTTKSRNATTNPTTNKTINKTRKNVIKSQSNHKDNEMNDIKDLQRVQHSDKVQKLKDIELITNQKDLQHNVSYTTTKTFNISTHNYDKEKSSTLSSSIASCKPILSSLSSSSMKDANHTNILNEKNLNSLLKTTTTTCEHQKDYNAMPHEARLMENKMETQNEHENEFRTKDNHSDSDSAVSSAPPSISPQPPPAGMDAADIWQTIRTYTTDIEKLQKEIEILQKENDHLHTELNLAKEQILETEKTVRQATTNHKPQSQQQMERIAHLEQRNHQLEEDCNELREQNELLEFRVLELEESTDKWSLQSHPTSTSANTSASASASASASISTTTLPTTKDVWSGKTLNKEDPLQLLFGGSTTDSGITSPHSQHHIDDDYNLVDGSSDELRRRVGNMLRKSMLDEDDKQCLQQVITMLQQFDMMSSQPSGPDSMNTTSSSDEASSLELVKSRISDYSSASSSSSARSACDNSKLTKSSTQTCNSRIVATVQPYNSSSQHIGGHQQNQNLNQQHHHHNNNNHNSHAPPTNTPNDSPRKVRHPWQSSSLSESGVFVESDFLSDASENNVCTQTDFDDEILAVGIKDICNDLQKLQRCNNQLLNNNYTVPAYSNSHVTYASNTQSEQKRLQYYKDRLELLESKVLIYESSGDVQAKRLADRLQREIQLEKELKELHDRVDYLECENSALDEEKCEFEEAENDTRLRLQRLEVELEILSQRNVELEMSREALSAKYKDCRSECLILRDDLTVSETQIRNIEEDKQRAKENLEFLHKLLPIYLLYNCAVTSLTQLIQPPALESQTNHLGMGNIESITGGGNCPCATPDPCSTQSPCVRAALQNAPCNSPTSKSCQQIELNYLKEEVKYLRNQIKDLNSRHYEAMESADSHWVDLEREYKDREEAYRAKECCLKQKIQKLQDCLRDDSRAADEKIIQMEETEKELKSCLVRISKEQRDLLEKHEQMIAEFDQFKEQHEKLQTQVKPITDALEAEKKQTKSLTDELSFMRKLQQESDTRNIAELELTRTQMYDLKREFLHIEVTNSELKEEVATLEQTIITLQNDTKEYEDKIRVLTDEVRTKDEMVQKLEKRLQRAEGFSLAEELDGSPSKRLKREEIKDLKTASKGLASALKNFKDCADSLPASHQFQSVARNVKKLADKILCEDDDEVSLNIEMPEEGEGEKAKSMGADDSDNQNKTDATPDATDVKPNATDSGPSTVDNSPESEIKEDPQEVTVGMAFIPDYTIDMSLLKKRSNLSIKKTEIFEVPSEMRKLSLVPSKALVVEINEPPCVNLKKPNKRSGFRTYLHRAKPSNKRIRRIVSCTTARRPCSFFDVSSDDTCQSEILHRSISFDSFHSLKDEAPVVFAPIMADAATETEEQTERVDKETETMVVEKVEHSVQAYDESCTRQLLDIFPAQVSNFIDNLRSSVSLAQFEYHEIVMSIVQRWEGNKEYRDGLEVLQILIDPNTKDVDNYEYFVDAMKCLQMLEQDFKPFKIPVFKQIEEQINEHLMNFHRRKMESEFYCTVYYPVKRNTPFADLVLKY